MLDVTERPSTAPTTETTSRICEQCSAPFAPRSGSGGKPQRFCSTECRMAYHAIHETQRDQRGPTCSEKANIGHIAAGDGRQKQPEAVAVNPQMSNRAIADEIGVSDETVNRARRELGATHVAPERVGLDADPDDFDWSDDDSIALQHQPATAIYFNKFGQLVIRQDSALGDEDPYVVISPCNITTFVEKICDAAGIPSVGG